MDEDGYFITMLRRQVPDVVLFFLSMQDKHERIFLAGLRSADIISFQNSSTLYQTVSIAFKARNTI